MSINNAGKGPATKSSAYLEDLPHISQLGLRKGRYLSPPGAITCLKAPFGQFPSFVRRKWRRLLRLPKGLLFQDLFGFEFTLTMAIASPEISNFRILHCLNKIP